MTILKVMRYYLFYNYFIMTKKPNYKKHSRMIEVDPANDFQEEMALDMINWLLQVIAMQIQSRHKNNKVELKYLPHEK